MNGTEFNILLEDVEVAFRMWEDSKTSNYQKHQERILKIAKCV